MNYKVKLVALILAICMVLLCGCANEIDSSEPAVSLETSDVSVSSNQDESTSVASKNNNETSKVVAPSSSSTNTSTSSKTSTSKPSVNKTDEIINTYGNSRGNLNNSGWAAVQGDWVYYSTFDALYKMKSDGSENQKLFDKAVNNINVVGDWIYFKTAFSDYVYRIKTNGTKRQPLLTNVCDFLVVKDKIYYTDSKTGYLYKADTSTENQTLLIEQDCKDSFTVANDVIYWTGADNVVCVSDLNGKIIKTYNDFHSSDLIVDGNIMYESSTVLSFDLKTGKEIKHLFKERGGAMDINVSGDWIYFIYWEDKSCIYKIKKDGTKMQKLSDISAIQVLVVGDWIFYTKKEIQDSDGILGSSSDRYRMRIDGSDNQMIQKWEWKYMNP